MGWRLCMFSLSRDFTSQVSLHAALAANAGGWLLYLKPGLQPANNAGCLQG
jgi:hypothetical protein